MSTGHPPGDDKPKPKGIQLDLYGIKADGVVPRPGREPAPTTWKEVGRRVNCGFMRFCVGAVELLADIPAAARAIVRGVGRLPGAISRRVDRAHQKTDRALAKASPELSVDTVAVAEADRPPNSDEAWAELQEAVAAIRALGVPVSLERLPTGQWVPMLGMPEMHPALRAAAIKALEGQVLDLRLPSLSQVPPAMQPPAPLTALKLSKRILHILQGAGYTTIRDVAYAGEQNIAAIPGIGVKSFEAIEAALNQFGYSLARRGEGG